MDAKKIAATYSNDPTRLMDMLIAIQEEACCVPQQAIDDLAEALHISRSDIEETLSFYHFFTTEPAGACTVYLNNSLVALMNGFEAVKTAFEKEAGTPFGTVTADGSIGLFETADIGMNDQEPAALINGRVFTSLTPEKVKSIVAHIKEGKPIDRLALCQGDGANATGPMNAMVHNNIRLSGPVILDPFVPGSVVKKAMQMSPEEVMGEIKRSNLRGRGGAGFPAGMKWEFCRKVTGMERYVFCNADEGEPGTFKDRVILTERPQLLFEGMTIAGYVIGAATGVIYLRGEYWYMKEYLEKLLTTYRQQGFLGKNIAGQKGFDFDIRIQLGAGAYVCGEESALLESAQGKRGEPRVRPPFPVEKGYLNKPTVINNVETFCAAGRILLNGHAWFRAMGTDQSPGTKLLSVSGDCERPGVYEVAFGVTIASLLEMAGAVDVQAAQIGGPSGTCVAPGDFKHTICYGDIATGGSVIIIGRQRSLKDLITNFAAFFADESCGACIPCRVGNKLIQKKLKKLFSGYGVQSDLKELKEIAEVMKLTSRCGLGQTAANPVITTMTSFPAFYDALAQKDKNFDTEFDLAKAVDASCAAAGRIPVLS
jgi:[NiFe] hydrogenase diaphorase moiety large subunit